MSAARSLGNLGNQNALTVDIANLKVGIVSTSPVGDLQVGAAITMELLVVLLLPLHIMGMEVP